jgi:hypothetical protein
LDGFLAGWWAGLSSMLMMASHGSFMAASSPKEVASVFDDFA